MYTPGEPGNVFWIVKISVKNNFFEDRVVELPTYWSIVAGDKRYPAQLKLGLYPPEMNVYQGQSGSTILVFIVPGNLSCENARLAYEESSGIPIWGSLSGGNKLDIFQWGE